MPIHSARAGNAKTNRALRLLCQDKHAMGSQLAAMTMEKALIGDAVTLNQILCVLLEVLLTLHVIPQVSVSAPTSVNL